jgi:Calcineurin-like phosphoesterase
MSFELLGYQYFLDGQSYRPFSFDEFKTTCVNVNDNNNCPIITVKNNNTNNGGKYSYDLTSDSDISTVSSTISFSSDSSNMSDSSDMSGSGILRNRRKREDKYNLIRSCDHFNVNIVETSKNIGLTIDDPNEELKFSIKYNNLNINSYDLIKMTNVFGSKKLQKNYEYEKIFKNFRDSDVLKLYNKKTALSIIYEAQDILKTRLKDIEENCIDTLNYSSVIVDTDNSWEQNNNPIDTLEGYDYFDYIDEYMVSLSAHQRENDYTHIKFIHPEKNDNLIVFGDFHGSFSSFVRHLLRFKKIGIIDGEGKIRKDFSIIFLGDIVDRGIYSYEILMILYLLLINNPKQIIMISGNHEELSTNGRLIRTIYGEINPSNSKSYIGNFINELMAKFQNLKDMLEVYTEIINIMRLQPSAIMCEDPSYKNKYIYMAHGFLPHDKKNRNNLNSLFKEKIKKNKSFCISNSIGVSIRWNDFYGGSETIKSKRTIDNNSEIQQIGKNVLDDAMESGILIVIRGHEDLDYSIKIIENESDDWVSINEVFDDTHDTSNAIECKNKDDILGNMTHVIRMNNKTKYLDINGKKTNYLAAVTTATCNDNGKNITSDGHMIITFSKSYYPKCFQSGKGYKYKFFKYDSKFRCV